MCEKKCENCSCNNETMTIKKSVYNHLIKTTNVVRTRNRQLEEENKRWKNSLVRTKKLNRKQKRFFRTSIKVALNNDTFSDMYYDEAMEMLRWLK
jgi:hypothetical protein|nr:MAG TPA: hypothetical protein [Caudoviricetes sp.]